MIAVSSPEGRVLPDRAVQRTRFSDGTEVVVNFGAASYTARMGGKSYVLATNDYAVKGPRIEQSSATSASRTARPQE